MSVRVLDNESVLRSSSAVGLEDQLGRPLRDLRISVTDRCNFRCPYCMPKKVFGQAYQFLARDQVLSFEEIARLVGILGSRGLRKVRLTGGEPLLRPGLPSLVLSLAAIEGIEDIALTTNGALLALKAKALRDAGLRRVTVSLDSLDDGVFRAMNDMDVPLEGVLAGIAAAKSAGFHPVKLNTVVKRGVNDVGLLDIVRYAREHGHTARFIEYMDVGNSNGWRYEDVVPAAEVMERIDSVYPLEPIQPAFAGEVAERYRFRDGAGELGIIASVTRPFCRTCVRARLSTDGKLYTCLFATGGHDLRAALRSGMSDQALNDLVGSIWGARTDRYSEERSTQSAPMHKIEMSYIGG